MVYKTIRTLFVSILIILFLFSSSNAQDVVRVKKVVDGDILLLTNGEKVRLIGIDAPERRVNPRAGKQVEWEDKDLKTIISMGEQSTSFFRG